MLTLTKAQARRFVLAQQGLGASFEFRDPEGVLEYIARAGCVQFDPLDVAGRNADLVLQSRVDGFTPKTLDRLLYTDRRLLDGYDKMMAIYRVEDWPCFRRRRDAELEHIRSRADVLSEVMPEVRREIEARGPVTSGDLAYDEKVHWPWGPTRLARAVLESMYLAGELVVHHKERTRKAYDLAERHIPAEILHAPDPNLTDEEFLDWYVLRRVGSVGLLWDLPGGAWLGMPGEKIGPRRESIARLVEGGRLVPVTVEGMTPRFYARTEDIGRLEGALAPDESPDRAAILAPLDNMIWDRRLVKELFGFEYSWEVYKPLAQREYGYYVLPVLYGDRFVARFDPWMDRKLGTLAVKNWWWEPGVERTPELAAALRLCFDRFLVYLGADRLTLSDEAVQAEGLRECVGVG